MSEHFYALQLEMAFRTAYPEIELDADSFSIRPKEALEEGLQYFWADGVIRKEECARLMAEFDFEDKTLLDFIAKDGGEERVQELINRLKEMRRQPVEREDQGRKQ